MIGLAFIGGEGPSPGFSRLLAQDASLIVAADSGLIAVENAGLEPDWVIGDMDSLDNIQRLEKYPADRIRCFPQDKDYTDTELALDLLWDKGCDEIYIAGGGGGRLDHLLAIRSLFEREKYPQRWVTSAEDIYCLDAQDIIGKPGGKLDLKLSEGTLVSVFPLSKGPWTAESQGLKWPLDGLNWDRGSFGISNRTTKERFTVRVFSGRFMLIVPLLS